MIRKALLTALTALLLTGGVVAVESSPASAQPAGCIAGQACLWTNGSYSGQVLNLAFSTYYHNGQCNYLNNVFPYTFDTTTSSVYNDFGSNYRLVIWQGDCHASSLWNIYRQTGANLAGTGWDDHIVAFSIQPN